MLWSCSSSLSLSIIFLFPLSSSPFPPASFTFSSFVSSLLFGLFPLSSFLCLSSPCPWETEGQQKNGLPSFGHNCVLLIHLQLLRGLTPAAHMKTVYRHIRLFKPFWLKPFWFKPIWLKPFWLKPLKVDQVHTLTLCMPWPYACPDPVQALCKSVRGCMGPDAWAARGRKPASRQCCTFFSLFSCGRQRVCYLFARFLLLCRVCSCFLGLPASVWTRPIKSAHGGSV